MAHQTILAEDAVRIAGENADYGIQSLFHDIEGGKFPEWDVFVQTMTPEQASAPPPLPRPHFPTLTLPQAEKFRYNILDLTKIWPHAEFPLRPVGKLVLNENPQNYFAQIEQAAFSPSHLVPGAEPSADPVLQSRLFSYPDTHRHRCAPPFPPTPRLMPPQARHELPAAARERAARARRQLPYVA